MAPSEARLEDYIGIFRERLNREDVIDQAKELMNDPRKFYEQFSKHLAKYEAANLLKTEKREIFSARDA